MILTWSMKVLKVIMEYYYKIYDEWKKWKIIQIRNAFYLINDSVKK